jgi:tetratricopeptide (TPR) repeat protein
VILSLLALAAAQAPSLPSSVDPMPAPRAAPRAPAPTSPSPAPPARAESAAEARYRACTEQVRSNADAALAAATTWRDQGGGLAARQCMGLALSALERWAPAATAFEQAAREAEAAGDARRADFWVQSGNAWVADGQPARAVAAFDAALLTTHLTDELRGEVHLDRARAQVALDNVAGARADIDRALQLVPADPFAWYLSAALARRENNAARAGTEIARARQLAPDNPDIMLMAGTLAGQAGNMEEAERLYRQVATAAPDSDAGRAAIASLATMREIEVPAATSATPAPAPAAPQGVTPAPVSPAPAPPPQSR